MPSSRLFPSESLASRAPGRRLPAGLALALLCASLCLTPTLGAAQKNSEADLKALKARIESVRKNIEADTNRRDSLAGELRADDLSIQSAREQTADIRKQRQASERKLAELKSEQAAVEAQVEAQRDALASELRLAYMNGREEQLKLLLNQHDPSELGRMLAYYGYFGRARAARIASINERLEHLRVVEEDIEQETQRLREIEQRQQSQVRQLASARGKRANTLASIQASLKSRSDQLAKLQREAAALEKLIDELRSAAADFPVISGQPFAKLQGKLPWPVKGKVLARFGQLRQGGPLKWQGVLIGAEAGAQVRAPLQGRVVYADWLAGMGLLVVVDHGGGFLSLYGHNEQIYRKVGDSVAAGDVLSTVGDDRGELYLEIRRGREPLDPLRWLRKP
jgi:septal ring factor EnvC (AmiA/AmiB activator)